MKKRNSVYVVSIILLIIFAAAAFSHCKTKQEKMMISIGSQDNVKGTPVSSGISAVQAGIDSGQKPMLLEKVLKEKDGYICAINTSFGPMSLKVKSGRIREDVIWGNQNFASFIEGSYAYIYSNTYQKWLRFDYAPDMKISEKQMSRPIMSESELLNSTNPEGVVCVNADVPESDFEFPMSGAFDATAFLKSVGIEK
ncbi:MAG: hypothetical protein NT001_02145 [Candidatus Woesearchaeota archaeon]|nr:hypothetical protein [Candidatus Woesearchaeota archaeon]